MKVRKLKTDILIAGGGASGVCAALQAARLGMEVILVEETDWLGGMLSAAGVSAIDGNHNLPSGIWGEFRSKIYDYYGGHDQVETGWVSKSLFEPKVANQVFHEMLAGYKNLEIFKGYWPLSADNKDGTILGLSFIDNQKNIMEVQAAVTIEATEYGDVLKLAGCAYRTGRESRDQSGEDAAPNQSDRAIQDLTYVAILRDFGKGTDQTIQKPANYDPEIFRGCCQEWALPEQKNLSSAESMLEYGRLPNNRFMINWPIKGNDFSGDLLERDRSDRIQFLRQAKQKTLCFVYFIQDQLGFRYLGLDYSQFETKDAMPLIPYIRESRRVVGKKLLTVNDILNPDKNNLFKQSIAVGDYPLDHHHLDPHVLKSESYPQIPAFGVPLNCLIPAKIDGLIVAEKSISVSHIVNGCTRLQPVVMQIGQATGALAALSVSKNMHAREINIRDVQKTLLENGGWLVPFGDMSADDFGFFALQRAVASGLIRGEGKPSGWENKYFIYPDQTLTEQEVIDIISKLVNDQTNHVYGENRICSFSTAIQMVQSALSQQDKVEGKLEIFDTNKEPEQDDMFVFLEKNNLMDALSDFKKPDPIRPITRREFIFLIDQIFNPFEIETMRVEI